MLASKEPEVMMTKCIPCILLFGEWRGGKTKRKTQKETTATRQLPASYFTLLSPLVSIIIWLSRYYHLSSNRPATRRLGMLTRSHSRRETQLQIYLTPKLCFSPVLAPLSTIPASGWQRGKVQFIT